MWSITKSPVDFGGGASFALDDLPATEAAWSAHRRLLTTFEGSLIRDRRSSDDAEADIGYDADGDLDEAALLTHCGAGDGFIAKLYDQSGNTRDWLQATTTLQPKIVSGGVVEAAMIYDGTDDFLHLSHAMTKAFLVFVCNPSSLVASRRLLASRNTAATTAVDYQNINIGDGTNLRIWNGSDWDVIGPVLSTGKQLLTFAFSGSSCAVMRNGVDITEVNTSTPSLTTPDAIGLGSKFTTSGGSFGDVFVGGIHEVIFFSEIPTAGEQLALTNNIMDYYGLS